MSNEHQIDTLNKLLKGQHMGVDAYESYLEKLPASSPLKEPFITIQSDLRDHANLLSTRILELGGTPKKSEGLVGKMELFMSELFDRPHDEKEIVKHAIKGENIYGNKMTEKIAGEELDEHNQQLIHTILFKQREHVDELKIILDNMKNEGVTTTPRFSCAVV